MKKSFFAFLTLTVALFSCSKNDNTSTPTPAPTPQPYFTLTPGNVTYYDVYDTTATAQTHVTDTLTSLPAGNDTTIGGRIYHIFTRTNGNVHDYYNITNNNNYYRFQSYVISGNNVQAENLYLKDSTAAGASWSFPVNFNVTAGGISTPVSATITNAITQTGLTKTVNGVTYNDVILVTTTISSTTISGLGGTITTDIRSYYAKKYGLIDGIYKIHVVVGLAGIDNTINSHTIFNHANY